MFEKKKIGLGDSAKDKITGFEGVVTGRAEYLTGCDQYVLQPKCKDDSSGSYPSAEWFDEGRLVLIVKSVVSEESVRGSKKGSDYSAPIK